MRAFTLNSIFHHQHSTAAARRRLTVQVKKLRLHRILWFDLSIFVHSSAHVKVKVNGSKHTPTGAWTGIGAYSTANW